MALEGLWGDNPSPGAKEKPHKDGRRGETAFRIKPHTYQRCSEGSNKPWAWVSRNLWWRCGSVVACCRVGGTECSRACMGPFEGGHHCLHYLHHSLASGQIKGREHSHPSTENWIKDLLSMAPPIRTRPSFPLSQSLPPGSFHKPLILLHQRADRMKTTITENEPFWSHEPQSYLTQWHYEPSRIGPTKMDRSQWGVLTKLCPLEKGMANHFSILALRTPWTVWKGKKIGHWKMNSPGW